MSAADRTLPASRDAELASLGAVLLKPETFHELAGALTADDFFGVDTRTVYESMLSLHQRGQPIDILTVRDEVRVRGAKPLADSTFLVDVADSVATAENALHYVNIVRDKSALRRFIGWAGEQQSRAFGDEAADASAFLDDAEADLFKLNATRVRPTSITTAVAMPAMIDRLDERKRLGVDVRGVPTGITKLDLKLGGLRPGNLIVLAGRPGMGKTAAALNWLSYAALRHQIPCLIFSLEMTSDELTERMTAAEGRVNGFAIQSGKLDSEQFKTVFQTAAAFARAPIMIDEGVRQSLAQITATARRWRSNPAFFPREAETRAEPPRGLVIVDYLQLAVGSGSRKSDSREQEVGEITRGLKALAKALRVPVVAVSQLNREIEKRTDKRPQLSDLRESGSIEQDADLVIFVHHEADISEPGTRQAGGVAEFIVRKYRHGDTFTVRTMWHPEYLRFDNYAGSDEPSGFGGGDR